MKKQNAGFTLMELLIVIGVLGILAAGLLAAIDPFEQLKKARDSNYRSGAIELLSATQRYYANHGYLPWRNPLSNGVGTCSDTSTGAGADLLADTSTGVSSSSAKTVSVGSTQDSAVTPCINDLIADGELKTTFSQGLNTTVYLSSWSKTSVRVCFSPESKSSLSDIQTNSHLDSITAPTAVVQGCTQTEKDAGSCLQCFQ